MFSRPGIERAILSIIINDEKSLNEVLNENIKSKHFSVEGHKVLYSIIMHLLVNEEVEHLDSMLVYNSIIFDKEQKAVEELGGVEYIDSLINACLFNNITIYIKQLKEAYKNNSLYNELKESVNKVEEGKNIQEVLNNFENRVSNIIIEDKGSVTYKVGADARSRMKERLESPKEVFGYKIGWKQFDEWSQGFQENDCVVVVGQAKTGKSTLLTNWSERLCSSGLKGLYIDTEMSDDEFEDRLISIMSEVPFVEIRNGNFGADTKFGKGEEKIKRVEEAIEMLQTFELYHEYMPDFNVEKVTNLAKSYKREKDIDFLVFDYIKMPNSDVNSNSKEYEMLGYFTTCLKDLAGVLRIPVITACQANRSSGVENTDPDASQIQGSHRILQLASKLYFIRNKTEYEITNEGYKYGNQVLHLKYQRHGSNDKKVHIQFDAPILKQREVN